VVTKRFRHQYLHTLPKWTKYKSLQSPLVVQFGGGESTGFQRDFIFGAWLLSDFNKRVGGGLGIQIQEVCSGGVSSRRGNMKCWVNAWRVSGRCMMNGGVSARSMTNDCQMGPKGYCCSEEFFGEG